MGLFDYFFIKENTFIFPKSFCKENPRFPLTKEKGNFFINYQSTDLDYSVGTTIKSIEERTGKDFNPGIHDITLMKTQGNLILFLRDGNWNINEKPPCFISLDFLTIDFRINYTSWADEAKPSCKSDTDKDLIIIIKNGIVIHAFIEDRILEKKWLLEIYPPPGESI